MNRVLSLALPTKGLPGAIISALVFPGAVPVLKPAFKPSRADAYSNLLEDNSERYRIAGFGRTMIF
jgi:hypothetical protein